LLEDLGGQRHLIGSDLEHDLVVQARDRTAIYAGFKQSIVDSTLTAAPYLQRGRGMTSL
jgi:hypothetical protein